MKTYIMVVTKQGMILKFEALNVRAVGRNMQGVRAIKLKDDDEVVSAFIVEEDPKTYI